MEILRCITVKKVCGKIDFDKIYKEKTIVLAKIFGSAAKAKPDQSDLGSFVRFSGRFRAINYETGEQFEAGSLILPSVAQDLLAGIVEGSDGGVEFGFEISVNYDAESATKYVYAVKPLFEASSDDPLERMSRKVLQLAAPKDEPAKEETKAEEPAKADSKVK